MNTVFEIIKSSLKLAWNHKHITGYLILILFIMFLSFKINRMNQQISHNKLINSPLPSNLNSQTIIYKDRIVYRDKNGKTINQYIPSESKIIESVDKNGKTVLDFKTYGLCHELGMFGVYDGQIDFGLDMKILYWNRYGMGVGSTLNCPVIFISRKMDDLSFGIFNNVESEIVWGESYSNFGDSKLGIGLRINF